MKIDYSHRRMMRYNVKSKLVKKAIAQVDPFTRSVAHFIFFSGPVMISYAQLMQDFVLGMQDSLIKSINLINDWREILQNELLTLQEEQG